MRSCGGSRRPRSRTRSTTTCRRAVRRRRTGRMDSPESVVEARDLAKRFEETVAVAGVDLRVGSGRVHGMVGPNGAGKTTLLAMLQGLVRPDAGRIRIFGRDERSLDGVAGVVERPRFYPYQSGRRNLALLAG